jgi:cysteine sulfinate desulfinase/cysteine desulfurase-like protein
MRSGRCSAPRGAPSLSVTNVLPTQQAKAAVDTARSQVADFLGCSPDEIIFTSGGSESANYALRGVCSL